MEDTVTQRKTKLHHIRGVHHKNYDLTMKQVLHLRHVKSFFWEFKVVVLVRRRFFLKKRFALWDLYNLNKSHLLCFWITIILDTIARDITTFNRSIVACRNFSWKRWGPIMLLYLVCLIREKIPFFAEKFDLILTLISIQTILLKYKGSSEKCINKGNAIISLILLENKMRVIHMQQKIKNICHIWTMFL